MPTAKLPHLQVSLSMWYMRVEVSLHGVIVELFVSTHWHDVEVRVHQEPRQ
jgi:hypothetical protein